METNNNNNYYQQLSAQVFGDDIPSPIQRYEDLDLGPISADVLRNYKTPNMVEKYIMPIILEGRDLLAFAPTGSDKTSGYLISLIVKLSRAGPTSSACNNNVGTRICSPRCLILAPSREIAFNIHAEAHRYASRVQLKAYAACGGASFETQAADLATGCDILISTPGRLAELVTRNIISLSQIKHLCFDDADRLMELGYEPSIQQVVEHKDMPGPGYRQTLMFSTTSAKHIQMLATDLLCDSILIQFEKPSLTANTAVTQTIQYVEQHDKRSALVEILKAATGRVIVYAKTMTALKELDNYLSITMGLPSTALCADQPQAQRMTAFAKFQSSEKPILIATEVTARGLPMPEISLVINYDLEHMSMAEYQRHLGHVRGEGQVISFFTDDMTYLGLAKDLMRQLEASKQEVPDWFKEFAANQTSGSSNTSSFRDSSSGRGRGSRGRGYGSNGASFRGGGFGIVQGGQLFNQISEADLNQTVAIINDFNGNDNIDDGNNDSI